MFGGLRQRARESRAHADGAVEAVRYFLGLGARHRFRWGNYRYSMRPEDYFAFAEIVEGGEYCFIDRVLNGVARPRVLDAGANIGLFSLQVFQMAPQARVIALEPAPDTHSLLAETRRLNPDLDWTVLQEALFGEAGSVPFDASGRSTGRRIRQDGRPATVSVPAVRLADVMARFGAGQGVDLIKMDIEGAEESVLRDAGELLAGTSAMVIELHDGVDQAYCMRVLRNEFAHLYRVAGRRSSKPLLVGARGPLCGAPLEPA